VLYREPMWLKPGGATSDAAGASVSVLYREPMWLKLLTAAAGAATVAGFSALP